MRNTIKLLPIAILTLAFCFSVNAQEEYFEGVKTEETTIPAINGAIDLKVEKEWIVLWDLTVCCGNTMEKDGRGRSSQVSKSDLDFLNQFVDRNMLSRGYTIRGKTKVTDGLERLKAMGGGRQADALDDLIGAVGNYDNTDPKARPESLAGRFLNAAKPEDIRSYTAPQCACLKVVRYQLKLTFVLDNADEKRIEIYAHRYHEEQKTLPGNCNHLPECKDGADSPITGQPTDKPNSPITHGAATGAQAAATGSAAPHKVYPGHREVKGKADNLFDGTKMQIDMRQNWIKVREIQLCCGESGALNMTGRPSGFTEQERDMLARVLASPRPVNAVNISNPGEEFARLCDRAGGELAKYWEDIVRAARDEMGEGGTKQHTAPQCACLTAALYQLQGIFKVTNGPQTDFDMMLPVYDVKTFETEGDCSSNPACNRPTTPSGGPITGPDDDTGAKQASTPFGNALIVHSATGTDRTTGTVCQLTIENPTDEELPYSLDYGMIPYTDGHQKYGHWPAYGVVPPHTTVVAPIEGGCTDVTRPPVPFDYPMVTPEHWYPADPNHFTLDTAWRPDPSMPGITVVDPEDRDGPVVTYPGTDIPFPYEIDAEIAPEEAAPIIIEMTRAIHQTVYGDDPPVVTTPFSGDQQKEKEALFQQTLWISTAIVNGDTYTVDDFTGRLEKQFEDMSGTSISEAPPEVVETIKQGADDFWSAFSVVGGEAKVIKDEGD